MNREGPQRRRDANLVNEFWSLQKQESYVDVNAFPDGPLSDPAEIDLAVSTAAFSRARQQLRSVEFGRFLARYYSLKWTSRETFREFVNARFIPEYVTSRSPAERAHYRAILKHV